jgi:hypothetical protein
MKSMKDKPHSKFLGNNNHHFNQSANYNKLMFSENKDP